MDHNSNEDSSTLKHGNDDHFNDQVASLQFTFIGVLNKTNSLWASLCNDSLAVLHDKEVK